MTYSADKLASFLPQAEAFALRSKDPSTKVGALILGPGYEVRSQGWNGAPRGCGADSDSRYGTREERLMWAVHAEANALYNAARCGTPIAGSALVATHYPCITCALGIVQSGIIHVVAPQPAAEFADRWMEHLVRTRRLFEECGVQFDLVRRV